MKPGLHKIAHSFEINIFFAWFCAWIQKYIIFVSWHIAQIYERFKYLDSMIFSKKTTSISAVFYSWTIISLLSFYIVWHGKNVGYFIK